ncbi:hypothetical protein OG800_11280 [Streptomyces sp. NBC_00445]|uniref:hypothetical protein n=1 Tax=Streptomyces sp. NBC_00445 TaxID=2975745 RepID=UPI002E1C8FB5
MGGDTSRSVRSRTSGTYDVSKTSAVQGRNNAFRHVGSALGPAVLGAPLTAGPSTRFPVTSPPPG